MHFVREIRLAACEIRPDGEWIYFISLDAVATNFTIYEVNYFTVSATGDFTKNARV